jgi:cysteine protease ATG4
MNEGNNLPHTSAKISTILLQYWYQIRNAVPMLSSIGVSVKPEDGSAYLFSTSFSPQLVENGEFMNRFKLVPWMTYRKDFAPIDGYYSDCGWGCMLRSAQMMLAEALFRRESVQGSSVASKSTRERIFRLFADYPDRPYSIHEMSRRAAHYGKMAGEWFEPTLTLLIVCELLRDRERHDHLRAIVARDGLLDASSIVSETGMNNDSTKKDHDPLLHPQQRISTSVLILVPLRLGLRELNEGSYGEALIEAMRFPQSIGMIGGKPAHSLYFCGSQGKRLIFLDPHTVQTAQSCSDLITYQCPDARAMNLGEVDPSLALGFLVSSYEDFIDLKTRVEALPGPAMFSITTKPVDFSADDMEMDDNLMMDEDEFEQVRMPVSPSMQNMPSVTSSSTSAAASETFAMKTQAKDDEDDDFTPVTKAEVQQQLPTPPLQTHSSSSAVKKKEDFVFL